MKQLLVMGGGENQIPLLQAAKDLSYAIVLCDEKKDVIGKPLATHFYCVDIKNSDILTEICKKMNVDGAVCNTEALMEVLSTVQSNMNYVGNQREAIVKLNNKYNFRKTQKRAGLFSPNIESFEEYMPAAEYVKDSLHDVIIKPGMSSGSRGVNVIRKEDALSADMFYESLNYSRNKKVLIEDYIDISKARTLEAEVFLNNGVICVMCLFRTIRDRKLSIVPQCYCSDNELSLGQEQKIETEIQNAFSEAGIRWGQYNVELAFFEDKVFIIEINARQGGMMLSNFVKIYSGIDLNKLLVSSAVSDFRYLNSLTDNKQKWKKSVIHYRVLCDKDGKYKGYVIDKDIERFMVNEHAYVKEGEYIDTKSDGGGYETVSVLDFDFIDNETSKRFEERIPDLVKTLVE